MGKPMSAYREGPEPRKLPTWWEGFRGGFGKWMGYAGGSLGWFLTLPAVVMLAVVAGAVEDDRARAEQATETRLVQERKFCEQTLAAARENHLKILKQQRDLARREALCNYLKSTWHEGRCFTQEISTEKP